MSLAFLAPVALPAHSKAWRCHTRPRVSRPPQATLSPPTSIANRADFPILAQKVNDHPLVYLDSAATSQKPSAVIRALVDYYNEYNANVHRGAHTLSARATDEFEKTRTLIAGLINAPSRDEIVFTRNATEGINLVARAWCDRNLNKGDVILVSVMEHHANLVPWQMAAAATGAEVVAVPLTPSQTYDVEALERLLSERRVKLVACAHVSNVLGCVMPVARITALARAAGAVTMVDACQSVPHMRVDVQELGCDFLVASGHKMCGPTGAGFLWGRREMLEAMPPYMGGGEMIADVFLDYATYAELPHKFEAGTPAIGEIVAFGAAVEYLQELGMENVERYEEEVGKYLWERLTAFREVTVYGPPPPRAALCSFNVEGVHNGDLATILDLEGVAVRSGHHCAQPLHRELGVAGSARASLYIYNTWEEVDTFIKALRVSVELLGGTLTSV